MRSLPVRHVFRAIIAGPILSGGLLAAAAQAAPSSGERPRSSQRQGVADQHSVTDQRIAELIEQLGDAEYAVRQRAQRELSQLGFAAFDALTEAENHEDIEIASQAKYLVRLIRVDWTRDDDPPAIKEILKDYELQTPAVRKVRMEQLAQLPDAAAIAALCRIVRFEPSQRLSKHAAMVIMRQRTGPEETTPQERAAAVLAGLDRSKRPAARWLRAYVLSRTSPQDALDQWRQLVEAEQRTLAASPQHTEPRFYAELLRRQVEILTLLKRPAEATAVIRQMISAVRPDDKQSIAELVEWLADQKAWRMIDEVAVRFSGNFDGDAGLLYTLAQARLAQGDKVRAAQAAERALRLNAGRPQEHLELAESLQRRGLMTWSDMEFRAVIDGAMLSAPQSLRARLLLSESLHDRTLDEQAGNVLKPVVDAMDRNDGQGQLVQRLLQRERSAASMRSRMNFFFAAHQVQIGSRVRQLELLETAIGQDPSDVDVLIALYHYPGATDARRKKTREQIKKAGDECRYAIEEMPEDPNPYNQLAWLVANTEGDFDEAISLSKKSIELLRANGLIHKAGGYYDTLARCYFAKGDVTGALRYQREAVRLEPFSQQISRQLEVFKKAADSKPKVVPGTGGANPAAPAKPQAEAPATGKVKDAGQPPAEETTKPSAGTQP